MIKKLLLLTLLPLFAWSAPFHTKEQIKQISESVVKIENAYVKPDYDRPWTRGNNGVSGGTGVIVEGNLILTAAHVVSDGTFIQVKKGNDAKKYTAKVKWIAHEADLALLELDDKSFFDGVTPRTFGKLPYRQDGTVVYGYPVGGDEISTTQGIVSRIEHIMFVHGYMDHIAIQIDAAINSGNSGGPAFDKEGKIIGIAIETLSKADGIGYLVPSEVIQHFFEDVKDGHYDGYPDDGTYIQVLENKNIKAYLGLGKREGVLIRKVKANSSADGFLKKDDIVLKLDSIDVAGDNTIKMKENGRISANYIIRAHQMGDTLKVKILRDKKEINIEFPLKKRVSFIPLLHDNEPKYYLFGGMVFAPLTINFLKEWGIKWYKEAPKNLIYQLDNQDLLDQDISELVLLSNILPNDENANYYLGYKIVTEVNGQKVTSFKQFVELIENSRTQYVKILFDSGNILVMDKEQAFQSDKETMKNYGIDERQRL